MTTEDERMVVAELLKEKLQEARDLVSHYEKAGVVYLAITASLATFALGDQSRGAYPLFEIVGLATTIFFIGLCVGEPRIRAPLEDDITNLNVKLERPLKHTELKHLEFLARFALIFAVIVLLGWIALVVVHPRVQG